MFVQRVEATTRLPTLAVRLGTRLPAPNTAGGHAIGSRLDEAERGRPVERGCAPMTGAALRDPAELRGGLETARRDGFALLDGETEDGLRSIGAPMLDSQGRPVAAMAILVRAARIPVGRPRREFAPVMLRPGDQAGRLVARSAS